MIRKIVKILVGLIDLEALKRGIFRRYGFDTDETIRGLEREYLEREVPAHVNWLYCLGGVTLLLFVVQIVTGIALAYYYKPTADEAHLSIAYVMNKVPYGWLIRSIHHWVGHLLPLAMVLHLVRVFIVGAYKDPREMQWVSGMICCGCVCLFVFTGSLLPWSREGYAFVETATSMIGFIPLVGDYVMIFVRGGENLGSATLTRFFVSHILLLPAMLMGFVGAHLWMVKRQGISGPL